MARREQRKPTRAEWRAITTPGLVVRRIPKPSAPVEDSSRPWDNAKQMFDTSADTNPSEARPPFEPGFTSKANAKASEGGSEAWTP
jgi:hypothetical protein